jgi:CRISPR-associated protein Csy1
MTNKETAKAMADEIIAYIYSRRDKKLEDFLKAKPKKNKQGEITNGAINARLLVFVKRHSQDTNTISSLEKAKKGKDETALSFQQKRYAALLATLPAGTSPPEVLRLKSELLGFQSNNAEQHEAVFWLTQWAPKARDISFATHVGKLTHSSSKSSSILDDTNSCNDRYLTTNSLKNIEVDTASSNAASLPIADILKISVSGLNLLDCLKNGDRSVFEELTNDHDLINLWLKELSQAYDSVQKQSYFLSKQIYYPIGSEQYHLLLPLTSSSIVQALHLEHKKYWDEDQALARKQKAARKYSETVTRTYPSKAYLHATGSNHSNASSLNGKRGGRISLLPCMPPQWASRLPSYKNRASVFDKGLSYTLSSEIDDLHRYLLMIKNKQLSISEPKRNAAVVSKLSAISASFFNYVETISNTETTRGWSIDSQLPAEQQLLFEPSRKDPPAMALKINTQWQKTLSKAYGIWLNRQLLKVKKLKLTEIHGALWADFFLTELREMIAIQEVTV